VLLPIGDENPRERTPYVTYGLVAINVLVYLLTFPHPSESALRDFAMHPVEIANRPSGSDLLTLLTSMFMHAGFMHLAGNMLFLWVFGDNVEDKLGHVLYFLFYMAAGFAASFAHIAANLDSTIPTLGASGAISGVVGAYMVMFPKHRVRALVVLYLITVVHIQAVWWALIWFGLQVLSTIAGVSGVAHLAHIGGFIAGAAVAAVWKYLLFPQKFGVHGADEPYPEALLAASRTTDRPTSVRRPFVTIQSDGIEYVDEPHARVALLRADDAVSHVRHIANVVATHARIPPEETRRRLDATRGVVARGLDRVAAERIQHALKLDGIATLVLPDDRSTQPPRPESARALAWNPHQVRTESATFPWETPFLYLAATVDRRPFVDIFVNPRTTLRVDDGTSLRFVDATAQTEYAANLRALASAILQARRGAAVNDGVRLLARGGGSWGWLAFRERRDYDDYAFWTYNLLLARRPIHRF